MRRNLKSVPEFSGNSPFTQGQIRWFLFNAQSNGLADADAVVKIGRRVYVDVDRFDQWIDAQQQRRAAAA